MCQGARDVCLTTIIYIEPGLHAAHPLLRTQPHASVRSRDDVHGDLDRGARDRRPGLRGVGRLPAAAHELYSKDGMTKHTIYIARTDTGLVGYGESGSKATPEVVQTYTGTSPFQHLCDEVDVGLGTAVYDLMGKTTGLPCHKLFGARCRQWVPVRSSSRRACAAQCRPSSVLRGPS
jgi:hypothetical protein